MIFSTDSRVADPADHEARRTDSVAGQTLALTVVAMLAFAANSVFCRMALTQTHISPAMFTIVRLAAGAMTLALLCRLRTGGRIGGSWPAAVALLGYAACFSFAYVSLTAATGALLLFGAVQATMILWGLIGGERLRPGQWIGFALALAGLLALLAPGVIAPDPLGAGLMLAAGIAWGVYSLLGRSSGDPTATTAGNFIRATPLSLGLALLGSNGIDGPGTMWAVLSGAIASGAGYAVWYTALSGLTATRAATVQLTVPVLAAVAGVLLLGETVTWRLVIVAVAVLAGVALVLQGQERSA